MEQGELLQLKLIIDLLLNLKDGSPMILVSRLMCLQTFVHLYQIVQNPAQGVDPLLISVDLIRVQEVEGNQCLLLQLEELVHHIALKEID
jgi:hypothetical protein